MTGSCPDSVLVLKTSSIGDVLLASPVAEALRLACPNSYLAWVVEERSAEMVRDNPFLDEVIVWRRDRLRSLRKSGSRQQYREELQQFRSQIRARRYDLCFDVQGFSRSLPLHLLLRAKKRVLLPHPDRWGSYTRYIWKRTPRVHAIDYHLDVIRRARLPISPEPPPLRLRFRPEEAQRAAVLLEPMQSGRPVVAIHARSTWKSKQWESGRFVELARRLVQEAGANVIFIGGPDASSEGEEMAQAVGAGATSAAGKTTLLEMAALLTHCRLLVTGDSGPMHAAVAVGTPVVALFGPTDPANYGPRGDAHAVLYQGLACSPCRNRSLVNPPCMDEITVERVFQAVRERLQPRLVPLLALQLPQEKPGQV